jgi:hypothetical protein
MAHGRTLLEKTEKSTREKTKSDESQGKSERGMEKGLR